MGERKKCNQKTWIYPPEARLVLLHAWSWNGDCSMDRGEKEDVGRPPGARCNAGFVFCFSYICSSWCFYPRMKFEQERHHPGVWELDRASIRPKKQGRLFGPYFDLR